MELQEAIRNRRCVRTFREGRIDAKAIDAMKQAILWAPSAGDQQSRRFAFVTDPETRQALGDCSYQPEIFAEASLVIVGCADLERIESEYGERGRTLYVIQDVAASVQNLLLTIHALGLGAVWIGAFEPDAVSEVLGLSERYAPQVLVPVGVPDEQPRPSRRIGAKRAFMTIA
ncbi:MAG: nitroreductase family protein [Planctomycetota bacterium]|jgi:nitroreductase